LELLRLALPLGVPQLERPRQPQRQLGLAPREGPSMILDGANFAEGYVGQGSGAVWRTEPLAAKRAKGARPTAAGGCRGQIGEW